MGLTLASGVPQEHVTTITPRSGALEVAADTEEKQRAPVTGSTRGPAVAAGRRCRPATAMRASTILTDGRVTEAGARSGRRCRLHFSGGSVYAGFIEQLAERRGSGCVR